MLSGLCAPRKRLRIALIASFITIIIVFSTLSYRSPESVESVAGFLLPGYRGNNTEQEIPASVRNATFFQAQAPSYIKVILNPKDTKFDRLHCPTPKLGRYQYLKSSEKQKKYFFALNLRQCLGLLPRLLGSIVETIRFLGPENCALSIVEGNSDDGTFDVLLALQKEMDKLGIEYHLQVSDIDPKQGDRIEGLAALRNLALEPMVNNTEQYSPDTAVVFINDVAICMEDLLELVHQRVFQKADMTCAMDWSDIDPAPIFYDIWIARAINGDTFWEIPLDGGWRFASNLFWNHPVSRARYDEHKPFQVFACWNGAVVFTAKPILEKKIQFRRSKPEECFAGEPRLFCKDLWINGYSRIAVIPSVNLEYSDKSTEKVKGLHGHVSDAVAGEDINDESLKIEWDATPPEKVKCMSDFADHSWVPWNQGFELKK